MYDWIIEADVYRLEKARKEAVSSERQGALLALLAIKRAQLAGAELSELQGLDSVKTVPSDPPRLA